MGEDNVLKGRKLAKYLNKAFISRAEDIKFIVNNVFFIERITNSSGFGDETIFDMKSKGSCVTFVIAHNKNYEYDCKDRLLTIQEVR